ncbi:MAG: chemotaxis protein [Colwellia sp.]|jgi:Chemotaxis signal transduction protein
MKQKNQQQNLLLFRLNSEQLFALNVLKIKEIITYTSLNQLPDSHAALAGVTELRGVTLPVIDLSLAMGLSVIDTSTDDLPSIVVTECNGKVQGFLVRNVEHIMSIDWHDIKEIPKASGKKHYATGVIKIEEKLVTLIDVEKIMHETTDAKDDFSVELLTKEQLREIKNKKLLVVDDSLVARTKIAATLDILGVKYQLVSGAAQALKQLDSLSSPFDMIISDIEMPHMNGYEFSNSVRNLANVHTNTYILLHTSLSVDVNSNDYKYSKANSLLTKFEPKALAESIYTGLTN